VGAALPELTTLRLSLRPSTPADAPEVFAFERRCLEVPDALRFIPRPPPETVEDVRARLERHEQLFVKDRSIFAWQVRLRGEESILGYAAFVRCNHTDRCSEVAYMVEPSHWGKGLAVEATTRVIEFGWAELGLHRVEAHIDPENAASIRTAEKLGLVREAHLRENHFRNGRYFDTLIYARLAPAAQA
jgi:ribosomal-protein-alanine N-acetyltransferase